MFKQLPARKEPSPRKSVRPLQLHGSVSAQPFEHRSHLSQAFVRWFCFARFGLPAKERLDVTKVGNSEASWLAIRKEQPDRCQAALETWFKAQERTTPSSWHSISSASRHDLDVGLAWSVLHNYLHLLKSPGKNENIIPVVKSIPFKTNRGNKF